jgi:hypothetical protein
MVVKSSLAKMLAHKNAQVELVYLKLGNADKRESEITGPATPLARLYVGAVARDSRIVPKFNFKALLLV